jgi:heptosyltransferase II
VKVLVIQTAFIGDVILATALLEQLHQSHPGCSIDVLVRKGNEGLLTNHPFMNELLVWDKRKNKFKNLIRLILYIRRNQYDLVINLQRFAGSGLLTICSGAKETRGFSKNPFSLFFTRRYKHVIAWKKNDVYLHEINRNQMLILDIAGNTTALPRLYPSQNDFEKVKPYQQQPYLCIAPASVWYTKQWPVEKWVEFIQKIPASFKIYLLGAPTDEVICSAIIKNVPSRAVSLCGKLTFLESAALLKGAMMNYVNDSAPLHLASAMNAPVTAIFCSTTKSFGFGPLSDRSFVIETNEPLSCKPCGLHGKKKCPEGHFRCAVTIDANRLPVPLIHSQ